MKNGKKRFWTLIVLFGDLLIVPISFLAGHYLRFGNFNEVAVKVPPVELLWMTLGYIAVFYFFDLYVLEDSFLSLAGFLNLVSGVFVSAVVVSFINYGLFLEPIGRGIFVLANIFVLVLVFLWRVFCFYLFQHFRKAKRVIIVGAGRSGREIHKIIRDSEKDFSIIGFLDDDPAKQRNFSRKAGSEKIIGGTDGLLEIFQKERVDQVVIAMSAENKPRLSQNMLKIRMAGGEITDMPDLYQQLMGRVPINFIPDTWFLKAKGFDWSEKSGMVKVKRFLDVVISFMLLVITLPIWLLIALAVKLSSKGPVFYTQQRIGRNDMPFTLIKFRSMIHRAEGDMPQWTGEKDTRVTAVGRVIRSIHLDELPQLLNVLKGEMSLVGPRPERPVFVREFKKKIPYYSLRHFLKPGLTGWAQVNYPYAASLEDSMKKLEYDLYYIYHMTLLLDLRILIKTLQNIVIRRKKEAIRRNAG